MSVACLPRVTSFPDIECPSVDVSDIAQASIPFHNEPNRTTSPYMDIDSAVATAAPFQLGNYRLTTHQVNPLPTHSNLLMKFSPLTDWLGSMAGWLAGRQQGRS
uniref:Uncharacterized protein n=1 Tax=Vespula pensylvanica TaxID=30213 RepID=A0A834K6K1_VESPE|nr:hypothetical protein H0235_016244 [Vespula pensylvanica]